MYNAVYQKKANSDQEKKANTANLKQNPSKIMWNTHIS